MWTLVLIGIFSGAVRGPSMQIDSDSLTTLIEMSGDITISQSGYSTEEACKSQMGSWQNKHSFTVNGQTVTVRSVECRDTGTKTNEGKGPRA